MLALISTWGFLPIALLLAAFGALVGAFAGIVGGQEIGIAQDLHVSGGSSVLSGVTGFFVGALVGFGLIYVAVFTQPLTLIGDIVGGLVIALIVLCVALRGEPYALSLRGYRKPSRRERGLIDPIVTDILTRMRIPAGYHPDIYISDKQSPEAWTHCKAIVLAQGMFQYDESESPPRPAMAHPQAFPALLAHEIMHWRNGDGVGTRAVWACSFPLIWVMNACYALGPSRRLEDMGGGKAAALGWFAWIVFWPFIVCVKFIIGVPMTAHVRIAEYEADDGAVALGDEFRLGLRHALTELKDWERPRTGWEKVILADHPTIEQRLERLEQRAEPIEVPTMTTAAATRPRKPVTDRPVRAPRPKPAKAKPAPRPPDPEPVVSASEPPPPDDAGPWQI